MKGNRRILFLGIVGIICALVGCRLLDSFGNGFDANPVVSSGADTGVQLSYQPATGSVMITGDSVKAKEIASDTLTLVINGDNPIVVGSILADMENGQYLRKVVEISSSTQSIAGNGSSSYSLIVRTEDAYLDEVFEDFQYSYKGNLAELASKSKGLFNIEVVRAIKPAVGLDVKISNDLSLEGVSIDFDFQLRKGLFFNSVIKEAKKKFSARVDGKLFGKSEDSWLIGPSLYGVFLDVGPKAFYKFEGAGKLFYQYVDEYSYEKDSTFSLSWEDHLPHFSSQSSGEGFLSTKEEHEFGVELEGKGEAGVKALAELSFFKRPICNIDLLKLALSSIFSGRIYGTYSNGEFSGDNNGKAEINLEISSNIKADLGKLFKADWAKNIKGEWVIWKTKLNLIDLTLNKNISAVKAEPDSISLLVGNSLALENIRFILTLSDGSKIEEKPVAIDWSTSDSSLFQTDDKTVTALGKEGTGELKWKANFIPTDQAEQSFEGKVLVQITSQKQPSFITISNNLDILVNRGGTANLPKLLDPIVNFTDGTTQHFQGNWFFKTSGEQIPNGILQVPDEVNSWLEDKAVILLKYPDFSAISKELTVSINAEPEVKILSPSNGEVFSFGNNISIAAEASDKNGTVAKVDFYQGSTKIGVSFASPFSFTWQNVPVGKYSLTAFATDNDGATSNSNIVDIVVNPASTTPPSIQITSPVENAEFQAGNQIAIVASATDLDGSIAKVEFYQGSTLLGESATSPYTFSWENVPAGNYSLTAYAIDDSGASSNSNVIDIVVNPANTTPPSVQITSPVENAEFQAGSQVTIVASATDPDGSIAKVEFYQGSTLLGESATSPYTLSWENVPVGNYSLTAYAIDDSGAYSSSNVIDIIVKPTDTVLPVLISSNPASGSIVVDISASNTVALYFSEPVKKGLSGSIVIKSWLDNTVVTTIPVQDSQIQVEGDCVKITPSFVFQSSQTEKAPSNDYIIEIEPGAITDLANNSFAGFSGEAALRFGVKHLWYFSTNAPFGPLIEHASVVYNNKIWVIGGANSAPTTVSTVYSSPDGVNWTLVSNGKFSTRWCHASVVFNNQMWIFGGMGDSVYSSRVDALSSSDGITWTTRTTQSFLNRTRHSAVVFNNKVWILGGQRQSGSTRTNLADVWSSPDGMNWTQVTNSAPWVPTWTSGQFACLVFDSKMWVIAQNKVWNSSDGANWTLVSIVPSPFWCLKTSSYVFDNKMWIVGGGSDGDFDAAFYSKDGINWIQCSNSSQDLPSHHSGVVFNNRLWILGGIIHPSNVRTSQVRWAW